MKRMIIAAAASGLLGLGLAGPAAAMPASSNLAPAVSSSQNDLIQVRGGHGHGGRHASHRGGRGHHYGWSRGRHRGWR